MTSKLSDALGTRLPSKRVMAIGLVAALLLFAGCMGGGNGGEGEGTTAGGEGAAEETTMMEEDGMEEETTMMEEDGMDEETEMMEETTEPGMMEGTEMTGMGTEMVTTEAEA